VKELVAHRHGGILVTGVAGGVTDRIAHLIYVGVVVPQDGESLGDLLGPEARGSLAACRCSG